MNRIPLSLGLVLILASLVGAQDLAPRIATQLDRAGENRTELETALRDVPADQKSSLEFLIAWLPETDLQNTTAAGLLENVRLAHAVRGRLPWQKEIPDAIFLNHVLPAACLDEPRDPWRADFLGKFWPLVENARSASEAAQILNQKIFPILNVKYSTSRRRASQSPAESISQGLASCSGLSILLVDACRAVGVPARVAGIPAWVNKRGNHTWVEIWDDGWHFTGAAEHDAAGLDRAWFVADAALSDPDNPRHSIYATHYAHTGLHFPLVWDRDNHSIPAENVTSRYRKAVPPAADSVRTFFRALDADGKKRVRCEVSLQALPPPPAPETAAPLTGTTRDESSDLNDILDFALLPRTVYRLTVVDPIRQTRTFDFRTGDGPQQTVEWRTLPPVAELPASAPPGSLDPAAIGEFAAAWFAAEGDSRAALSASAAGQSWPGDSRELRNLVWQSFLASGRLDSLRDDLTGQRVRNGEHLSPWVLRDVGERPATGWPLVIAMHGGGNAPQELNDSQWRHMQIYYRDHPEVSGYRYLALRAPNNSWNGFYDNYVYPLIGNLIAQQVAWNDVDPNRVFLIGYSHGGYGAFAIGPKMPDRFAAIHASASAGTDGETSALGLHTARFTWMVGGRDTAFGRRERCEKFAATIDGLRGARVDRYPASFFLQEKSGHGGLPDRDWLVEMLPHHRNPVPREIDWELTDPVVDHHYWISVDRPEKGRTVSGRIPDRNRIEVTDSGNGPLTLWLDQRLIDPAQPLEVMFNGATTTVVARQTLADLCTSLLERRDSHLAAPVRIELGTGPTPPGTR